LTLQTSDEVKPVAEIPLDNVKNGSGQALSKSALKKLAKRQSWLETKAERKAIQKQKRKAKVEQNKAEGKYEISYSGIDSIKFCSIGKNSIYLSIARRFARLIRDVINI